MYIAVSQLGNGLCMFVMYTMLLFILVCGGRKWLSLIVCLQLASCDVVVSHRISVTEMLH